MLVQNARSQAQIENLINNNVIESSDKAMNTQGIAINNGTIKTQNIGINSDTDNSSITNTGIIEAGIGVKNDYGTIW